MRIGSSSWSFRLFRGRTRRAVRAPGVLPGKDYFGAGIGHSRHGSGFGGLRSKQIEGLRDPGPARLPPQDEQAVVEPWTDTLTGRGDPERSAYAWIAFSRVSRS